MPDNKTYLGDGAYAQFTGYSMIVYTDNGIHRENEVSLEPSALVALNEFAKEHGVIK